MHPHRTGIVRFLRPNPFHKHTNITTPYSFTLTTAGPRSACWQSVCLSRKRGDCALYSLIFARGSICHPTDTSCIPSTAGSHQRVRNASCDPFLWAVHPRCFCTNNYINFHPPMFDLPSTHRCQVAHKRQLLSTIRVENPCATPFCHRECRS